MSYTPELIAPLIQTSQIQRQKKSDLRLDRKPLFCSVCLFIPVRNLFSATHLILLAVTPSLSFLLSGSKRLRVDGRNQTEDSLGFSKGSIQNRKRYRSEILVLSGGKKKAKPPNISIHLVPDLQGASLFWWRRKSLISFFIIVLWA